MFRSAEDPNPQYQQSKLFLFVSSSQVYSDIYYTETLNLAPVSTPRLWVRPEWELLVEPAAEQLHFHLGRQRNLWFLIGYKKETYQRILQGTFIPCNSEAHFRASRSPTVLIFVHMTLSHCLIHRVRTNQHKIPTYTCVNSV